MLTYSSTKNIIKHSLYILCFLFAGIAYPQQQGIINFSLPAGFYESGITISLTTDAAGSEIRLTSDGSEPGPSSFKYISAFRIMKTTVVRARLFSGGTPASDIFTSTYFINEKTSLPVFSISTAPANFFDADTGIYVMGPNPGSEYPYFDANFWKDWERPVHIEFFETTGNRVLDMDAGAKIFGAWSRALPQKSLALFARKKYGYGKINYKFFSNRNINSFESIVLRNSGNDWEYTMMRDALMQGLVDNIDLETQAYRPSVVFINGQYWGIHNIREKINEHFLASHHNVNPDSIDILENGGAVVTGTDAHYKALMSFISSKDLSVTQNYQYVSLRMDINNFISYAMSQIYFNNADWPGNNIKFWRPQRNNGKWRWILYDTDFGFGLWNDHAYTINTLEMATAANGPNWPNPPWSTLLLRKLLTNDEFKQNFISRFSEFSNTVFKPDVVVSRIRLYRDAISPEISRHFQRWGSHSYEEWMNNVEQLEIFAQNRIQAMRLQFAERFSLNESRLLSIHSVNSNLGSVSLNSVNIDHFPWSGSFYKGIPLNITAVPAQGYVFKEWKGIEGISSNSFTFNFPVHLSISPVFVPDTAGRPDIVINEINYNSHAAFDCEDWIELYNNTDSTVDLSDWIFKDSRDANSFYIPAGTKLLSDSYLVLCSDTAKFFSFFPEVKNVIGPFDFSISNSGELIRLLDKESRFIDSVHYLDTIPWPLEPDGSGSTLALKDPSLDNSLPENWGASSPYGTPGSRNDISTSVSGNSAQLLEFTLGQNYPNPFNISTRFKYVFAGSDYIKFKVFDVLGRVVYYEDQGFKTPGIYPITFSADKLSSGIYYYQISNSTISLTRKMLLLR